MSTDQTAKLLGDIKRSIDELRKSVDNLAKTQGHASTRERGLYTVPNIDSLNEEEIEELRLLSAHRDDVRSFTEQRLADPNIAGMYRGFHDMGLVNCMETMSDDMICLWVSPKALWAVGRHDTAAKENASKKRLDTMRYSLSIIVPSLVSIAAVVLTWLLAKQA